MIEIKLTSNIRIFPIEIKWKWRKLGFIKIYWLFMKIEITKKTK